MSSCCHAGELEYSRQAMRQNIINRAFLTKKKCICNEEYMTSFGIPYDKDKNDLMKGHKTKLGEIFRNYVNRKTRSYDLETACDIYELAKDMLLDETGTWLYMRSVSTVSDLNLLFVEDTQNFILTGERSCNLDVWMFLLEWDNRDHSNKRIKEILSDEFLRNNPGIDMVDRWIKHERGLNDMLYSIYAFFCGNPMRV